MEKEDTLSSTGFEGAAAAVAMEKKKEEELPRHLSGGGADDEGEISRNAMMNLVMLTENSQLQRLAVLLRNNEQALMRRVVMTEVELWQYLDTVNDAYRNSMKLLDDSTAFSNKYGAGSSSRSAIAREVHDYVKYGLNMCLQNVRNCCMRLDAITKLRAHFDALADALAGAAAVGDDELGSLAAEASDYKASMWEYCHKFRSASARAQSKAYSDVLKLQGIELPDLLRIHQLRLGYGSKDFEDLQDAQKLDVYNSIIDESKRANIRLFSAAHRQSRLKLDTLAEAVSVFIIAAGSMVYDIYTTEHDVERILRGSLNVLAAVGAFAVEAVVTKAVTTALAKAGAVFVTSLAGFVVGALAGLIFVRVSGRLIDLIVRSPKVPDIEQLKFHTAVMPDGMSLAIDISRG